MKFLNLFKGDNEYFEGFSKRMWTKIISYSARKMLFFIGLLFYEEE